VEIFVRLALILRSIAHGPHSNFCPDRTSTQLLPGITFLEYLELELKLTIGPYVADIRQYLGLVCQPYMFRILTRVDRTPT